MPLSGPMPMALPPESRPFVVRGPNKTNCIRNTSSVGVKESIRTERVVITLLIPLDGAATNTAWLLTLLSQATRIVGGQMFVERTDSESHRMIEYTPSIPKRSDTSASSTAIDDPGQALWEDLLQDR